MHRHVPNGEPNEVSLVMTVLIKVDLRVLSFDVPPQEILSRDSVTVSVEAVIYFRISNPVISVGPLIGAVYVFPLLF